MQSFYDRFCENAKRQPCSVAVEIQRRDCVETYTFDHLRRMAESVGRWLAEQKIEPGTRVAIFSHNHARCLAVYLGILAVGAVAVPLDTGLQPQQLATFLKDSGCVRLFCDFKRLAAAREAAGSSLGIVILDQDGALANGEREGEDGIRAQSETTLDAILAAGPENFSPLSSAEDSLAVLLYTSGATADPKGVMLCHANLIAEINAALGWAPLNASDSVLAVLPLFHVLGQITNFVVPLAVGARVVFLETLNSEELLRALSERKITALCVVPQFFYLIHEQIFKEIAKRGALARTTVRSLMALTRVFRRIDVNPGKLFFPSMHRIFGANMRYLLSAGSRFDPKIARDFWSLGIDVMQAYGLTETTAAAFATPPGNVVIGSVGLPLAGVQAKISDPQFDEAIGKTVGEIAIRGNLVMKGYWNRPEATAAAIRDGWLYSGDLGYFDARGNLFITGRKKEIIILSNGKNIYPEEVEAHYLKSPLIKEICVLGLLARACDPASKRLHAIVVPNFDELKKRKIVNAKEVLRFDIEGLSAGLPSTKRIGSYEIWREDLPRTTTRKIKRFEVERRVRQRQVNNSTAAEPGLTRPVSAEESIWLQQPEVQQALTVVRKMCKTEPRMVQPDDNLELDLGFDSLQRVELVAELEQALGRRAGESRLSEVYTVRQLVDAVRDGVTRQAPGPAVEQSLAWQKILAEDPSAASVQALARPGQIGEGFWYLVKQLVALVAFGPFRLRASGLERVPRQGPFLICPNHQSFIDSVIITSLLPWPVFRDIFFVGTSEVFGAGFMRHVARWRSIVVVDPDGNLIPGMRAGAFGLKHGRVLGLHPEGERSIDGEPKVFKRGAAILSIHMQAPIVPVAIEGFYDAWPRGRRFPKLAPLQIKFGDPIHPPAESEASVAAYEELTEKVRMRVVAMWQELRCGSPANCS
jgi:long-chain acyl-CoA synthetase